MRETLIALAALFATLQTQVWADLIVNGGFEDPVLAVGGYATFSPTQPVGTPGGWYAVGDPGTNQAVWQTSYVEPGVQANAYAGFNALDLTGGGNVGPSAGVTQTVATVTGTFYDLSFYVGHVTPSLAVLALYFPNGDTTYYPPAVASTAGLSINGGPSIAFSNPNITNGFVNWEKFSYIFKATTSTANITFLNGTPLENGYAGLDNVSLNAVPEPSSVALAAIGGIGVIISAIRRGRQKHAAVRLQIRQTG